MDFGDSFDSSSCNSGSLSISPKELSKIIFGFQSTSFKKTVHSFDNSQELLTRAVLVGKFIKRYSTVKNNHGLVNDVFSTGTWKSLGFFLEDYFSGGDCLMYLDVLDFIVDTFTLKKVIGMSANYKTISFNNIVFNRFAEHRDLVNKIMNTKKPSSLQEIVFILSKVYSLKSCKQSNLEPWRKNFLKGKSIKGYEIIQPSSSEDLWKWGLEFTNCLGDDEKYSFAVMGGSLIFKLVKSGEEPFLVEFEKKRDIFGSRERWWVVQMQRLDGFWYRPENKKQAFLTKSSFIEEVENEFNLLMEKM